MVEATFVRAISKAAYFDVEPFGTGAVVGIEFNNAREIIKTMATGDVITAKIVALDGEGGMIELSITEASRQKTWGVVQELFESGEPTKVRVVGVNPGGLLVQISDLKGFLPLSQMNVDRFPKDGARQPTADDFKQFVGDELTVKVINVNAKKNKLILSERESAVVNTKELLANYKAGDIVKGTVSGLADFGIFVRFADNPQIEGLVHISEIDHRIVDSPKDAAQMNDPLEVKILDIRDGRVYLSLKALKNDPWKNTISTYKAGAEVEGTVYKYTAFGALVNLADGLQGSLHLGDFGSIEELKDAVAIGSTHTFVVDSVKADEKRIVLKLKK
jgi:small subunit ribosomal protein S1